MKAYINDTYKVAYVLTDDVEAACRLGMLFVQYDRDLADAGWVVSCHRSDQSLTRWDRREVDVVGSSSLSRAIREGPECDHSCPRHPPEATG